MNNIKKNLSDLPGESSDVESIQTHVSSFTNVQTYVQSIDSYSLGVKYNP